MKEVKNIDRDISLAGMDFGQGCELIAKNINEEENKIQAGIDQMIEEVNENALKAMRRVLPSTISFPLFLICGFLVIGTKLDWNPLSYSMMQQMKH